MTAKLHRPRTWSRRVRIPFYLTLPLSLPLWIVALALRAMWVDSARARRALVRSFTAPPRHYTPIGDYNRGRE